MFISVQFSIQSSVFGSCSVQCALKVHSVRGEACRGCTEYSHIRLKLVGLSRNDTLASRTTHTASFASWMLPSLATKFCSARTGIFQHKVAKLGSAMPTSLPPLHESAAFGVGSAARALAVPAAVAGGVAGVAQLLR